MFMLSVYREAILISSSSPYREAIAYTRMGDVCKKCGEEMRCLRRKVTAVIKSYLIAASKTRASSSKEPMVGSGVG